MEQLNKLLVDFSTFRKKWPTIYFTISPWASTKKVTAILMLGARAVQKSSCISGLSIPFKSERPLSQTVWPNKLEKRDCHPT